MGELIEGCRQYLMLLAAANLPSELCPKLSASDLVQETFVEAQRDFPNFAGDCRQGLLNWLRRILLNNVADARRRYEQTGKRQIQREVSLQDVHPDRPSAADFPISDPSPSRSAMSQEEQDRVQRAIAALPEHYRTVVLLHHREGLSFEEIGKVVSSSAEAVRKTRARARRELDQSLENPDESR